MSHFDYIAHNYEESWTFSDKYIDWLDTLIFDSLNLTPKDKFTDIGGGTGRFIRKATNRVKFISVPACVEPSAKMADLAAASSFIDVFCEDAHSYFQRKNTLNKILFKEVIHHVKERKALWKKVRGRLDVDGKILIVTRPKAIDFPLFNGALEAFSQNQPDSQLLIEELVESGFHVETSLHSYPLVIPKAKWLSMVGNRFMSDLGKFDKSDLMAGIEEIKSKYKGDELAFNDKLVFISAKIED